MLRLAIVFAVIALIAAGLGFYGLSDVSASFAKFFALIFAVLFVVALIAGVHLRRTINGLATTIEPNESENPSGSARRTGLLPGLD